MNENILIVDDEREITDLICVYLSGEGYHVYSAATGGEALDILNHHPVSLAVLDIMLPDIDGFALCEKIRQRFLFPIIMLSARSDGLDKINGLTLGADDYMTKPFQPLELMARIRTQLRRYTRYNTGSPAADSDVIDIRGLHIEKNRHECTLNEEPLDLTPLEFRILWYLCAHRGTVVPAEELFESVWGESFLDQDNTVMAHIARLREKMHEVPRKPSYIKTVWGVGYKIE